MSTYQNVSDQELLCLLKADDEAAFNELYKRYWSGIFLVARNRLSNDNDAEEIVQDIFCNLWRKRSSFVLDKSFKAYFSVAVKYEVINRSVRKGRENSFIEQFSKENTEEDLSTLETLSFNELEERLYKSITLLPERCQLVFKLRFEKEYSQKEIANELDISEKTVEAHLSKARKHIRTSLGSTFPFYIIGILYLL
jgi:RNA polymerase sigma-70 factor (ECF subfamily)